MTSAGLSINHQNTTADGLAVTCSAATAGAATSNAGFIVSVVLSDVCKTNHWMQTIDIV
jgi:hypothetical protein